MTFRPLSRTTTLCIALIYPLLLPSSARSAPAASPALAYTLNGALWTVRADGSDRLRLTGPGRTGSPELSPDGRIVAFVSVASICSPPRPPGSDGPAPFPNLVTVRSASGHGPTWSACGMGPAWSPDSRQLAYFSPAGLMVRSSGGRNARLLLHRDRYYGYVNAVWSPNGRQLAVPLYGPGSGLFQNRTLRLAIVPLQGRARRIVIRFPKGSLGANNWANPNARHGSFPTYSHLAWARDSRHLLVETLANANVARLAGIWEAPSSGGVARVVAGSPGSVQGRTAPGAALDHATGFAVSRNGTKLATDPHGRLWVGNLSGGHGRLLTVSRCPLQQLRWLDGGSTLGYIVECSNGSGTTLGAIRLATPAPHVLVRSGPSAIDINSPFLCISCG